MFGSSRLRGAALAACVALVLVAASAATAGAETALNVRRPAPSPDGSEIAFGYMGDIWKVPAEGGRAERLTVHEAFDFGPAWSPDGGQIAFTSTRRGNDDVFVMPSEGGAPERLTCHATWDDVECWTRDGAEILFTSSRDTLEFELFRIPAGGGMPRRLIKERVYNVSPSPDGRWIAFTMGRSSWWRRYYRGSAARDIWIRALDGGPSYRLVNSDVNDDRPMWGSDGSTIYFMSERADSVTNIWQIEVDLPESGEDGEPRAVGEPTQVTRHDHDGVQFARISDDGTLIVYEWNAGLWRLEVPGGSPAEVRVDAPSDLKWNDDLRLTLSTASEYAFSPDEDELALVCRGEVYVCKFKDGEATDAMRITETPDREKDVAWMPDGETLLFASDRAGVYDIYAVTSTDEEEAKLSKALRRETVRLTDSAEDDFLPVVSPDGERIAYMHGSRYLWAMDADGGSKQELLPNADVLHVDWSPDGQWIALSRTNMGHKEDIFVIPAGGGEEINVSQHPNDDFQPRWTDDGKRLSFASRTDDGQYTLKYMWLTRDDYWKTTAEREEDEEDEEDGEEADDEGDEDGDDEEDGVTVEIDFEGLNERTVTIMNMRGGYDFYAQTSDGHFFAFRSGTLGSADLWIVDWEGNKLSQVSSGGSSPERLWWDGDDETCYYLSNGRIKTVSIDTDSGAISGKGGVGFSTRFTVDVPAERVQMFNEAWRFLWNGFYDPNFHGVDWPAIREKYEPLAMAAYTEQEFREVVREMIGELSASHLGIYKWGGGGVNTGRLGIYHDEDHDGPGVLVRKVIDDGPADREGITAGEYVVSIEGTEIGAGENYHCLLTDATDREIWIEVAESADGRNAREVRLRPVSSGRMRSLVYEQWVRENRARVEERSGGRLGYLHIPGMGTGNLFGFEEDLFAQGEGKEGLVIDIRGNGGGSVHDGILRYLDRRNYGYTVSRTRPASMNPLELYEEELVLIIDESCYSDAEIFPMGWKSLGLGPVVGVPTHGSVIGTNDLPLIDGTMFRVPGSGWYDLTGKNLENWGIPPDVYVEALPEDAGNGIDRQLDRAIEILLEAIE
jgi:tricorn protease